MSYPNSALRPLGAYMRGDIKPEFKQEGNSEQPLTISSSDSSPTSSDSSSTAIANNLPKKPPYIPIPIPTMPAKKNHNQNQSSRSTIQNRAPNFTNGYRPGDSPARVPEAGVGDGVGVGDGPSPGSKAGVGRGGRRNSKGEGQAGGRADWQDSGRHTPRQIDQYRPGPTDSRNRPSSRSNNQREGWRDSGHQFGGQRDNQQSTEWQGGRERDASYGRGHGNHDTGRIEFTAADVHAAGTLIHSEPQRVRGGGKGKARPLDPEKTNVFSRDRPKNISSIVSPTDAENISFAFLCCLKSEERFARCAHCNALQANYLELAAHLKKQCYKQRTFQDYIHLNDHAQTLGKAKELVARDKSGGRDLIHVLATYADDCMRGKGSNANQGRSLGRNQGSDQAAVDKAIADLRTRHATNIPGRSISNDLAIRTSSSVPNSSPASRSAFNNNSSLRTGFDNAEDQDKFAFAFLVSALEGESCLGCRMLFDSLKEMEGHFRITRHFENPTYQTLQSLPSYSRVLERAREVISSEPRSEEKFFELLVARVYQIRDNTSNNQVNFNTPPPTVISPQPRKRKAFSFIPVRIVSAKHKDGLFSHFDRIPECDDIRESAPGFTIRFLLPKSVREKTRNPAEDYRTYLEKRLAEELSREEDPHPNRPDSVSIFSKPTSNSGAIYMDMYYSKQANFMTAKERARETLAVDGDVIPVTEIGATLRLEKYLVDSRPLEPAPTSRATSFASVITALESVLKPIGSNDYKLEDVWGYADSSEREPRTVYLDQGLVIIASFSFPVAEYKHPKKVKIDGQEMSFEVRGKLRGKFSVGKRARVHADDHDIMDTS